LRPAVVIGAVAALLAGVGTANAFGGQVLRRGTPSASVAIALVEDGPPDAPTTAAVVSRAAAPVSGVLALLPRSVHDVAGVFTVTGKRSLRRIVLRGTDDRRGTVRVRGRVRADGTVTGTLRARRGRAQLTGRLTLGAEPLPCADYFRDAVMAEVLLPICQRCHVRGGQAESARLRVTVDDPAATAASVRRVLDPSTPSASLFVVMPSDQFAHGGGIQIGRDSTEATILRAWASVEVLGLCAHDEP